MTPCLECGSPEGMLARPVSGLDDPEGARLAADLPEVIDAHVHLFPDRLFDAIWAWFARYGWSVRYRLHAREVMAFLKTRGVTRMVGLHYAHLPGLARSMNAFMAELAREEPALVGLATVYPGEDDAVGILEAAFAAGLRGVKLHSHVQRVAADDPVIGPIAEACVRAGVPLVMHAGREPKSPAYKIDPYAICGVERVEALLTNHPRLKLVVPHLGVDEAHAYLRLLERHENLWLDTTMVAADFFPFEVPWDLVEARPERILYGTDFPNLPYAWDREVVALQRRLRPDDLEKILGANARRLYAL
jgi:predicted TIM-barrel fold metal-dependent hydrolase